MKAIFVFFALLIVLTPLRGEQIKIECSKPYTENDNANVFKVLKYIGTEGVIIGGTKGFEGSFMVKKFLHCQSGVFLMWRINDKNLVQDIYFEKNSITDAKDINGAKWLKDASIVINGDKLLITGMENKIFYSSDSK